MGSMASNLFSQSTMKEDQTRVTLSICMATDQQRSEKWNQQLCESIHLSHAYT